MSNRWMKATVRYEAAKLPGFKPSRKQLMRDDDIPTLAKFMDSLECCEAQALLHAASRFIELGRTGNISRAGTGVLFSSRGLETLTASGSKRVGITKANMLLATIHKDNLVFDPVLFIRQELDRIADLAP